MKNKKEEQTGKKKFRVRKAMAVIVIAILVLFASYKIYHGIVGYKDPSGKVWKYCKMGVQRDFYFPEGTHLHEYNFIIYYTNDKDMDVYTAFNHWFCGVTLDVCIYYRKDIRFRDPIGWFEHFKWLDENVDTDDTGTDIICAVIAGVAVVVLIGAVICKRKKGLKSKVETVENEET